MTARPHPSSEGKVVTVTLTENQTTGGYVLASDRHNIRTQYMAESVMAENDLATVLLTMLADARSLAEWALVERVFSRCDLDANEAESLLDDVATKSEERDAQSHNALAFFRWEESCDSLRDYMAGV